MALSTLLTISDFTNPFEVFEKNENNDGLEKYFDDILAKAQKKFLIKILGHRMYNTLVANYPDSGFYDGLIVGKNYTYDSVDYVYEGVLPALMRYSYYMWQRFNVDQLQSSGSIQQNFKESKKVIPVDTMVLAYSEMVDLINSNIAYAPTIYHYINTQYTLTDWSYEGFIKINSFNF